MKREIIGIQQQDLQQINGISMQIVDKNLINLRCTCGKIVSIDISKTVSYIKKFLRVKPERPQIGIEEAIFNDLNIGDFLIIKTGKIGHSYPLNFPLLKITQTTCLVLPGASSSVKNSQQTWVGYDTMQPECFKIVSYNKAFEDMIPENLRTLLSKLEEIEGDSNSSKK